MRTGRSRHAGAISWMPRAAATVLVAVLSVLVTACGSSGTPAAATGGWSAPVHPEPVGQQAGYVSIYGVSCPTRTFCAAVDETGDALLWNGTGWSTPSSVTPDGTLNSVSCSAPSFCVAMDAQEAVTFDGRAWSPQVPVGPAPSGPTGGQYEVSCVSPTFCAAVNTGGGVALFDGTSWGHDAVVDDGTAARPVQNISCATKTFCVVVSATGTIATFDGKAWTRQLSPGRSLLHSVSCPTPTFCMAVDLTGHALVFDGSSWAGVPVMPDAGALSSAVSCPRAGSCKVARSDGSVTTWQAGSWTPSTPVLTDGTLATADISCASTAFCALVSSAGTAATFHG